MEELKKIYQDVLSSYKLILNKSQKLSSINYSNEYLNEMKKQSQCLNSILEIQSAELNNSKAEVKINLPYSYKI